MSLGKAGCSGNSYMIGFGRAMATDLGIVMDPIAGISIK
jgi:hypothetical protein